jgi:cation diffusion facilitator family transporter
LIANAWHHRSDAFSSIGTSIGTGVAVFLGSKWTILDPLAAAVVSVFILKAAWQILAGSLAELVESSVDADKLAGIISCITSVEGIHDPHNIRARKVGSRLVVDAHVRVSETASVKESHDRVGLVEDNIRREFGSDSIITIHVEPLPSYP